MGWIMAISHQPHIKGFLYDIAMCWKEMTKAKQSRANAHVCEVWAQVTLHLCLFFPMDQLVYCYNLKQFC